MQTFQRSLLFMSVLAFTCSAYAEPEYRSHAVRTLAPILEEGAYAVMRVNLAKADVAEISQVLETIATKIQMPYTRLAHSYIPFFDEKEVLQRFQKPENPDEIVGFGVTRTQIKDTITQFREKGNMHEFYLLWSMEGVKGTRLPTYVTPIANKTEGEIKEIHRICGELNLGHVFVRHDFIWVVPIRTGNQVEIVAWAEERFKTLKPVPMPVLDESFARLEKEGDLVQLAVQLVPGSKEAFHMYRMSADVDDEIIEILSLTPAMIDTLKDWTGQFNKVMDLVHADLHWAGFTFRTGESRLWGGLQMKNVESATRMHDAIYTHQTAFETMFVQASEEMRLNMFTSIEHIFWGMGSLPWGIDKDALDAMLPKPQESLIAVTMEKSNVGKFLENYGQKIQSKLDFQQAENPQKEAERAKLAADNNYVHPDNRVNAIMQFLETTYPITFLAEAQGFEAEMWIERFKESPLFLEYLGISQTTATSLENSRKEAMEQYQIISRDFMEKWVVATQDDEKNALKNKLAEDARKAYKKHFDKAATILTPKQRDLLMIFHLARFDNPQAFFEYYEVIELSEEQKEKLELLKKESIKQSSELYLGMLRAMYHGKDDFRSGRQPTQAEMMRMAQFRKNALFEARKILTNEQQEVLEAKISQAKKVSSELK